MSDDYRDGEAWYPRELPVDASAEFKRGWFARDKAAFAEPDGEDDEP